MKKRFNENKVNSDSTQRSGMLHGISTAWVVDAFQDLSRPTVYETILPLAAVALSAVLLLWVINLRKRLAKSKLIASTQSDRYRKFFNDCPDALLVVEEDGSIVSSNPRASMLLQMDGETLLAQRCWDFIDQVSHVMFSKQFNQCLSGKSMHCEVGIQTEAESHIPVEVTGNLQLINGKNLVLLYVRDKRVQLETEDQVHSLYKQMDEATAELEEKESMLAEQTRIAREELITNINHRLRTPLDGIMGMGQLLADSTLSIDQHNYVHTILNSSSKLLRVIESMSKDSESIWKEPEDREGLADMRVLCETLSRSYEPLALRKGIEFRCDCQEKVPAQVVADTEQLHKVLSALLDHAFQLTHNGLVMLNIECRRENDEETELYFQVIDTGLGIDEEFHSPVNELSVYGYESGVASGLGLAACRQIVKQMGGTIVRTNTVGKGSTVYFGLTFPLPAPRSDAAADADEQPSSLNASSSSSLEDIQVLLVDDNKVSQRIAVAMLQKAGARVTVAGNGQEALSRLHERNHDVVLMDCQMPVMDGYKATTSIRSMSEPYCNIPVIALTAHSLKHELQACRDSGMNDCLIKPIEQQKLIEIVYQYANESGIEKAALKAS
jgi:PAS domain S-box-containing protein